jgi:hypothetical protein
MAPAGVSTAAAFTQWQGSTGVDLADSTGVGFTGIDSTMVDFTTTGFSSVDRSGIPGGDITRTMGITITANPTPRRPGTIVLILPAITLM